MTIRATTLVELAAAAGELYVDTRGDASTTVSGVAHDSRKVSDGDLFFCVVGAKVDGHELAASAKEAGARALCVQRPTEVGLPEIVVSDVRAAMPLISAAALGYPSRQMKMLGVTGTNGKTTTAFLIESILRAAGHTPGLIGTIETHIGNSIRPGVRTTPESLELQELLAEMRDASVDSVAMEVTSHALVLNRVDGVFYEAVAFTNLTQDHLDFHPTMDDYFAAKAMLFSRERAGAAAVNIDDRYGALLKERATIPTLGFGLSEDADVRALDVELESSGSTFLLSSSHGESKIQTWLAGPFNISNCLAAATVALQAGIDIEAVAAGITNLHAVPGRFESVDRGQPFSVIVDYAHTPDSLDNVLAASRRLATASGGRLIAVFGAGGDRDRGKRPLMGIAAAKGSDYVIVTSDNPRSEVPEAIIEEIVQGVSTVRADGPDLVSVDRTEAIDAAIAQARPGDVVVIAGKGHETGQEFAAETRPFDDRKVAAEALSRHGWAGEAR
jgi:UDP-N-acetylmuramoyl-L-alanyl-D-glutamate--2,6-diaminopimelate ligase